MLDIKFIRENKDLIAMAVQKKHLKFDVEELLKLDDARRALLLIVEQKRFEHNQKSQHMSQTKIPERRMLLLEELRAEKAGLEEQEEKLKEIMVKWQALMLHVPNVPDISVPNGESDQDNKEVRVWGTPKEFGTPPKNHSELMESCDLADFIRGGDVAGFRGYFLKNEGALLSLALWQFTLEYFAKKGFTFMSEDDRKEILESLASVDEVVLTEHIKDDPDRSICRELRKIHPDIFANGGDRTPEDAQNKDSSLNPEAELCRELGIETVWNVGKGGKIRSSTELVARFKKGEGQGKIGA